MVTPNEEKWIFGQEGEQFFPCLGRDECYITFVERFSAVFVSLSYTTSQAIANMFFILWFVSMINQKSSLCILLGVMHITQGGIYNDNEGNYHWLPAVSN